jgi:hypothetical protein
MKNILKFGFLLVAAIMFSSVFVACNDEEELGEAPRLFRPVTEGESGGQWIKLSWDYLTMSDYYQVELSRDSFLTIDKTILAESSPLLIETDIEWDTEYQVRIKAVGDGLESEFYVCENVVVPDYPTLLQDIPSSDIIDNAVIVRWISDDAVPFTSLEFIDANNEVYSVELTNGNLADGFVMVDGLNAAMNYIVKIYSDDVYRGKKKFGTKAAQEFENPVDLRELSVEESNAYITQTFIDGLESNTTVVLKGGQNYTIPSIAFSKNIKFVTGLSFYGKAKFTLGTLASSGNFNFAAGATLDKVEFEGIDFVTGADKTTSNFGGRYVFNTNPSTLATVTDVISFENCSMRYLRGVLRAQSNVDINHVKVNNCVLDSIGGYGVINGDNTNSFVRNMTLTNSTVTHAEKILVNSKSPTSGNIIVSNCTFNWTPTGPGNYYLDFGAQVISGEVVMTNCILASVYNPAASQTCNGFRSSTNVIAAEGNYRTADMSWTFKTGTTDQYNGSIIEATLYNKVFTELWNDPAKMDYTFKDTKFEGKATAGDPRWW